MKPITLTRFEDGAARVDDAPDHSSITLDLLGEAAAGALEHVVVEAGVFTITASNGVFHYKLGEVDRRYRVCAMERLDEWHH